MKYFNLTMLIALTATAVGQWTMTSSTNAPPPPPPPQTGYWSGILDPSRAANWSDVGVQGGIPNYPACSQSFTWPPGASATISANGLTPTGAIDYQNNYVYSVGDKITDRQGNLQTVIVAGTSKPPHPIWPTVVGGTVVDNTVTWTMGPLGPPSNPLNQKPWQPGASYALNAQIQDDNGNTETATINGVAAQRYVPAWPTGWTQSTPVQTCDLADCSTPLKFERTIGNTDTDLINRALAACNGTSSAVTLAASTFILGNGIAFNPAQPSAASYQQAQPYSNVVLRGSGPDKTKLVFISNGPCSTGDICATTIGSASAYGGLPGAGSPAGAGAAWLGTDGQEGVYHQGSTMLVFGPWDSGDPANLRSPVPGNVIHLDQRNDELGICPAIVPSPAYNCTVPGATESGNVATITTTIPHGFHVGDCVGQADIGPNYTNQSTGLAYNSNNNVNLLSRCETAWPSATNNFIGWFKITAVSIAPGSGASAPNQYSFTANVTGLPDSGDGKSVVDTGGILNAQVRSAITSESGSTPRNCPMKTNNTTPGMTCQPGEVSNHGQDEMKMVTRVIAGGTENCPANDNCLEVNPPIYFNNWRSSQAPAAWFGNVNHKFIGIEDLTADFLGDGQPVGAVGAGYTSGGIKLVNTINSWVKNTRLLYIPRSAVWCISCFRVTIAENYIFGSKGLTSTSYGFEMQSGSSRMLMVNNICQRVNGCYMTNVASGNVAAYNFNSGAAYANLTWTASGIGQVTLFRPQIGMNHESAHYNLYEGNVSPGLATDNVHGTGNVATAFRNRAIGQDDPLKYSSIAPVQMSAFNRASSFVGNVIGIPLNWPGAVNTYSGSNSIWNIGLHNGPGWSYTTQDNLLTSGMLRWGNYDTVSASVNNGNGIRWCGDTSDSSWTTVCRGIVSATYQSGGTATGPAGSACVVSMSGGAGGTLLLPSGTLPPAGSPIIITNSGINLDPASPPQSAAFLTGVATSATCSGTIQISAVVGPISEVPTIPITFQNANAVPANHTLPPSFFMATRPDWFTTTWGTPGWPAIGPDVDATGSPLDATCTVNPNDQQGMQSATACNGVAHMAYMNPAQICWNHLSIDQSYQRTANITDANWSNSIPNPSPNVSAALTGGVVSLTVDQPFSLPINDAIRVSGVNPGGYNGNYLFLMSPVLVVGLMPSNIIRYVIPAAGSTNYPNSPGNPGPYVGGGTFSVPNIRNYNARDCYPNATY